MDVVDARWEKRNLGVSCTELTVARDDSPDDVRNALAQIDSGYQVIKVPVGSIEMMETVGLLGFSFMEASVAVEHSLRLPAVSSVVKRLADAIVCSVVPEDQSSRVTDRVHAGMFDTDRIYLDPRFGADQAARRYVNWIHDEIDAGATLFETVYKDQPTGFFLFREGRARTGLSVLSGLYDRVNTPGMGLVLLYLILEEGARRKMARISSRISANNLAVVKTHAALGFSVVDIQYVFVKHQVERASTDGKHGEV